MALEDCCLDGSDEPGGTVAGVELTLFAAGADCCFDGSGERGHAIVVFVPDGAVASLDCWLAGVGESAAFTGVTVLSAFGVLSAATGCCPVGRGGALSTG